MKHGSVWKKKTLLKIVGHMALSYWPIPVRSGLEGPNDLRWAAERGRHQRLTGGSQISLRKTHAWRRPAWFARQPQSGDPQVLGRGNLGSSRL